MFKTKTITSNYSVTRDDDKYTIFVDATSGHVSINLCYAVDLKSLKIKKIDSTVNGVSIYPKSAEKIENQNSVYVLNVQFDAVELSSDQISNWWLISEEGSNDSAFSGAHAPTHLSGGSDALPVHTPHEISDSTNSLGTSSSFSLSDHVHAHGNRGGGSLHALAISGGASGFLSGSDKAKLDSISNDYIAAMSGTFGSPSVSNRFVTSGDTRLIDPLREYVVSSQGGDFTSVSAACAAITDSGPTQPYLVDVYPGLYIEQPFTVPQFVTIKGQSTTGVIIISAQTGSRFIKLTNDNGLENFVGIGPASSSCVYISSSSGIFLKSLIVKNSDIGLEIIGSGSDGRACATIQQSFVTDNNTCVMIASGSRNTADGLLITGSRAKNGIKVSHGALLTANNTTVLGVSGGVELYEGAELNFSNLSVRYTDTAIRLVSGSRAPTFRGIGVFILSSSYRDIVQEDAGVIATDSGLYDINKVSYFNTSKVNSVGLTVTDSQQEYSINSELQVGTPEKGRESSFGEGDSYSRGVVVFTTDNTSHSGSDGSNFIDVSTSASIADQLSTFSFQASGANNSILIGSSLSRSADLLKHYGYKIDISSSSKATGSIVTEIWNGSLWIDVGSMQTDSDSPYSSYGKSSMFSNSGSYQIRLGITSSTPWVKKNINGNNLYWSRLRISESLNSNVNFNYLKVHTSRTEINEDGFVEHFGLARHIHQIIWHHNLSDDMVASPDNATIDLSTNISLTMIDNSLSNNQPDGVGGIVQIPDAADISLPLTLRLGYIGKGAVTGDIVWNFYYRIINEGDTISSAQTNITSSTIQTIAGTDQNILRFKEFNIDARNARPGRSYVAFAYQREGSSGSDTYTGAIDIVIEQLYSYFWH
jgi:hypothetical protein